MREKPLDGTLALGWECMTGAPRGPLRASTAKRGGSSFEALLGEDGERSAPFCVSRIELGAVAEEQIDDFFRRFLLRQHVQERLARRAAPLNQRGITCEQIR